MHVPMVCGAAVLACFTFLGRQATGAATPLVASIVGRVWKCLHKRDPAVLHARRGDCAAPPRFKLLARTRSSKPAVLNCEYLKRVDARHAHRLNVRERDLRRVAEAVLKPHACPPVIA